MGSLEDHKRHQIRLVHMHLSRKFKLEHEWEGFYGNPKGWATLYDTVPKPGEDPDCAKMRRVAKIFQCTTFWQLQHTVGRSMDTGGFAEDHREERNGFGHLTHEYRKVKGGLLIQPTDVFHQGE